MLLILSELLSLLAEMLPALGLQLDANSVIIHEHHSFPPLNASNQRDRHAGDATGNALAARGREQKLVFVSAMQSVARLDFVSISSDFGPGDGTGEDLGANLRFLTDMREVGGETITDVDHGRGEFFLAQELTHGDARHRMKVPWEILWAHFVPSEKFLQDGRRSSKLARDIDLVAWLGARPQDCLPLRNGTKHHDVGENSCWRFGRISACEGHLELVRKREESSEKSVDPVLWKTMRKGQREECRNRLAPHGSDIAEAACQATMSDYLGRMPFPAKVNALEAEVSGDQSILARGPAQHGTVIANAGQQNPIAASSSLPQPRDQHFFRQGHETTISIARGGA